MNEDAAKSTGARPASSYPVLLQFHGDLSFFLPNSLRSGAVERSLREKSSVKDVIEACGVPHPEVDLIVCDGAPVGFRHQIARAARIDVFPFGTAPDLFPNDRLQRAYLRQFVADGHLGKLARDLRLLGIDVVYSATATDDELIAIATSERRALLTRDRRLLMHAIIQHGYFPRSQTPEAQTLEVLRRFELRGALRPYSRCLRCNAALAPVAKTEVIGELEPLTRIYYEDFRRCAGCGTVYWQGSHFAKLQARIDRIAAALD